MFDNVILQFHLLLFSAAEQDPTLSKSWKPICLRCVDDNSDAADYLLFLETIASILKPLAG